MAAESDEHLIHVEEEEIKIEHHPEDWIAFGLFWALAFIVFLQFFTRYVLNNSLAWTEEIACAARSIWMVCRKGGCEPGFRSSSNS